MFDETAREAARGICFTIAVSSCSFGLLVSSLPIPQQRQILVAGTASAQQQPQIQHYAAAAAAFPQQTVKVPELIKQDLKDAESVLRASKLLMGQPEFVASNEPPGTVVRQYPQAGSVIRIGATVLVWVSAERPKQPQTQQPASGTQRD